MEEQTSKRSERVALAFSGGGFRATLFHAGVCLRLAELGLLGRTEHVSGTSGGAIFAAFLLTRWNCLSKNGWREDTYKAEVQTPLVQKVTGNNFRNSFMLETVCWALLGPIALLLRPNIAARLLDKFFFSGENLDGLPSSPRLSLNATELRTGTSWRFSQSEMGSYWSGQIAYRNLPSGSPSVATGVAASAAFPFLFRQQVISLPRTVVLPSNHPRTVKLIDGGIYDNIAVEPFLKPEFDRENFVVVSDAGYPSTHTWGPKIPIVSKLARLRNIGLNLSDNLRRRWVVESLLSGHRKGCYVRLSSTADNILQEKTCGRQDLSTYEGALPKEVVDLLARTRTDLDRFSSAEADLLAYHGYTLTDACLLKFNDHLRTNESAARSHWPGLAKISSSKDWRDWAMSVLAKSSSHLGSREDPVAPEGY